MSSLLTHVILNEVPSSLLAYKAQAHPSLGNPSHEYKNPLPFVILNEVKNLFALVLHLRAQSRAQKGLKYALSRHSS